MKRIFNLSKVIGMPLITSFFLHSFAFSADDRTPDESILIEYGDSSFKIELVFSPEFSRLEFDKDTQKDLPTFNKKSLVHFYVKYDPDKLSESPIKKLLHSVFGTDLPFELTTDEIQVDLEENGELSFMLKDKIRGKYIPTNFGRFVFDGSALRLIAINPDGIFKVDNIIPAQITTRNLRPWDKDKENNMRARKIDEEKRKERIASILGEDANLAIEVLGGPMNLRIKLNLDGEKLSISDLNMYLGPNLGIETIKNQQSQKLIGFGVQEKSNPWEKINRIKFFSRSNDRRGINYQSENINADSIHYKFDSSLRTLTELSFKIRGNSEIEEEHPIKLLLNPETGLLEVFVDDTKISSPIVDILQKSEAASISLSESQLKSIWSQKERVRSKELIERAAKREFEKNIKELVTDYRMDSTLFKQAKELLIKYLLNELKTGNNLESIEGVPTNSKERVVHFMKIHGTIQDDELKKIVIEYFYPEKGWPRGLIPKGKEILGFSNEKAKERIMEKLTGAGPNSATDFESQLYFLLKKMAFYSFWNTENGSELRSLLEQELSNRIDLEEAEVKAKSKINKTSFFNKLKSKQVNPSGNNQCLELFKNLKGKVRTSTFRRS